MDQIEQITEARIIFEDTDAGGVMYFGRACRWIEIGFNEWFRSKAMPLPKIKETYSIFFIIQELNVKYHKTLHYDDEIVIKTVAKTARRYSIQFETKIFSKKNSELCVGATHKMVPVNFNTKKIEQIPNVLFCLFQ
jgi:acyl-CoA thioester hydrolase